MARKKSRRLARRAVFTRSGDGTTIEPGQPPKKKRAPRKAVAAKAAAKPAPAAAPTNGSDTE